MRDKESCFATNESRRESPHQAPPAYSILESKLWFPILQVSALSAGWEPFSPLIQLCHYPAASGELQQGMSPGKETSVGCRSCLLWLARWLWDPGLLRAKSLQLSPCLLMNTWKASYLPWGTTARKSNLANFCKAANTLPLPPSSASEACAVLQIATHKSISPWNTIIFACHGSTKTSDESDICVSSVSVMKAQLFCGFTPDIRSSKQSKSKGTVC